MNEQTIQEQYQHIISLLQQKRLKEAQSLLETFLWDSSNWSLRNRLEQAQISYRYMLQYMKQGVNDPERPKLYRKLLAETWEIADQVRLGSLDEVSSHYYHSLRKNRKRLPEEYDIATLRKVLESFPDDMAVCRLMPDNQNLDAVLKRHEETNQVLFLATWSNSAWTAKDEQQAKELLESELLPVNDLCLFTSAVTLSLMECFDMRKFAWLLDATTHAETHVNQRALVGIAIALHIYPARLSYYPELTARLSLFNEDSSFGKQLNRVYIQLLRSQETEKIDKKMREEIIPEMMKNVSIMRNMKFGFEDNAADENDLNPDWEKAFEQSGLGDKIREMNELQLEGADVYMSTFAQLKSYPFFREPYNWFYPFDMQHSSLIKEFGFKPTGDNAILSLILQSGFFCDSDKYSLCFTMAHIPQTQREMMLSQMTSQDLNDLADESKSSSLRQYAQRPDVNSNQYIHDLYRFFKLNQRRLEFRDIFKEEIALHRIPALKEILCKPGLLAAVADFHFRKQHYTEALEVYQNLINQNHTDADIFQKAGYCLQKEKRYKEAVSAYCKADILKPDHVWTIRHLATCYRQMRDFTSALEYYRKAETIQPENHNILFYTGSCLAEQEKYEEALQYFFKLDFIENNNVKAWRAIGWCSFVSGKHEQAMKYYNKILDSRPLATDYLNAGHVAWRLGNLEKAAELYGKAALESGSREAFREMFSKDKETLIKQGINEKDIPLMMDLAD
ncbi:tetratricopeptide repeat protein [Bacteroides fluxus]|uniref:Tetratricopeptide repeat protein n=1 Tax=Bacteroides fluxus YIT 12057 TaxID=763034 RepID=F3PQA7_9BACE|nr:tetratricopeptide repeat protein [Bacteroides fluxus]EGF59149.1 tetratricopeptide repeat protein [Bacteroides fluxus YIT 12057]